MYDKDAHLLSNGVILRPDPHRPPLESHIAKLLAAGHLPDSRVRLPRPTWSAGRPARVALVNSPFSLVSQPIKILKERAYNLQISHSEYADIKAIFDWTFRELDNAGIIAIDEMMRVAEPVSFSILATLLERAGYDWFTLDAIAKGLDPSQPLQEQHRHLFTADDGTDVLQYGLTNDEIMAGVRQRFKGCYPDVWLFATPFTHQWGNARELINRVECLDPDSIKIAGGMHAHALPGDVLRDSSIDIVAHGQQYFALTELLDFVTCRPGALKSIHELTGIAYRGNNQIIISDAHRGLNKETAQVISPDLSLICHDDYSDFLHHSAGPRKKPGTRIATLLTSTGCNTGCTFCAIPGLQGGWVGLKPDDVRDLFAAARANGIGEILISDDMILHDPYHAIAVSEAAAEQGIALYEEGGLSYFTLKAMLDDMAEETIMESHPLPIFRQTLRAKRDGLTLRELIRRLAPKSLCTGASGAFYGGYVAFESGNPQSLRKSHKPTINAAPFRDEEMARLFSDYGMSMTYGTMLGFVDQSGRSESLHDIVNTIHRSARLRNTGASFINAFIRNPLPGSPDFQWEHCFLQSSGPEAVNTDLDFHHSRCTYSAPDGNWNRQQLNTLQLYSYLLTEGVNGLRRMQSTGTWPVDR